MRRTTFFLAAGAAALLSLAATAQTPPAPFTDEMLQRYGALCQDTKAAMAGRQPGIGALAGPELDTLAKARGFSGREEAMEIATRIGMVEMFAPDGQDMSAMAQAADPDMKALIARAQADAPAVKANAGALAACKAG